MLRTLLALAAVVEAGTGLVLLLAPAFVITLLLGEGVTGDVALLGRLLGVALLSLGVACWPSRQPVETDSSAFRGMLAYNAGVALYLAAVGTVGHRSGVLLWPAVVLHTVVALLLVRARRDAASADRAPAP